MAAVVASLAASAIGASSASAVLRTLPDGHVVSYQPLRTASVRVPPFDTVFGNVDYNGGPVMPSNTNYMVLWSPQGRNAYPPGYIEGLERYFGDLAHDSGSHQNVDSVSTQYNDTTGAFAGYDSRFGGALIDTHPYPASQCPVNNPVVACLTDAQIQTELERLAAERHLTPDLTHEYFLLTPPHVESCFSSNPSTGFDGCSAGERPAKLQAYCAYHGNTGVEPMLLYANDGFVPGIKGCDDGNHPNGISDGELSGGLSHEHNESITDPIPNDAWTNGAGANQGLENGDQCDGINGTPLGTHNGAAYNQVINGHFYWYQEEWSNQGHTCLQRYTPSGRAPRAAFTVTAGSGLGMSFDASSSSPASGIADYTWQFNDTFGDQTVEHTTPTVTHTFPAAGAYSTGLTVYAPDGLATGTGRIVITGKNGFTPGFTFSPQNPGQREPVTFSALTTVSNQPVTTYFWDFGDGSTGSGPTPTHAYGNRGTYTVKAVLFSGVGSAFPGAGAAPIVTRRLTVH